MSPTANANSGQLLQYLTFWLGDDVFGMDIRSVREIIQCRPMTSLPLMPAFVRGVINLRGSVVPVIDLHARFGRPPAVLGKKSCIVIFDAACDGQEVELGVLVDAVSEVIKLTDADVDPPPAFGNKVRRDFIQGIGKVGTRFVLLLEPDRAFNVAEMAELCEQAQAV